MAEKPIFNGILQVAVVVNDCDATARVYWEKYGIGPWAIYEFNPDTVSNMILDDKKEGYSMRLALTDVGGVQWELIQPRDDKSIYASFLKESGEGLHHVAFSTQNDYQETMKFFRDQGHRIVQGGTFAGLTYTYLDTEEDLKVISEIYNWPEEVQLPEPDATIP